MSGILYLLYPSAIMPVLRALCSWYLLGCNVESINSAEAFVLLSDAKFSLINNQGIGKTGSVLFASNVNLFGLTVIIYCPPYCLSVLEKYIGFFKQRIEQGQYIAFIELVLFSSKRPDGLDQDNIS